MGGVGVEGKKEFSGYGKVQHQTRMGETDDALGVKSSVRSLARRALSPPM